MDKTMPSTQRLLANSKVYIKPKLIANSSKLNGYIVGKFLEDNADVIDDQWIKRHAAYIYGHSIEEYEALARKARKKDNPKAYMGFLINLAMKGNG